MSTKTSEPNKFIGLKKTIAALQKDVAFFRKCLKYRVVPNCCQIRVKSSTPHRIIRRMEMQLVKDIIRRKYSELDSKTLECYALHLKLTKDYPVKFQDFLTRVKVAEDCEADRKRKKLDKKLNQLRNTPQTQAPRQKEERIEPTTTPMIHPIEGLVVNRSTTAFTEEQLTHLNKGLGYAITTKPDVEQIIIDVETAITQNLPLASQNTARTITSRIIKEGQQQGTNNNKEARIIKELKEKPVYYVKADKGNTVVVMDKEDYDKQMQAKINDGPYRQLRVDPLPGLVKHMDKTVKECKQLLGDAAGRLRESNPILPRIKGLPKVHKPGNEMREIVSAVGSPTQKLAKWLVKEFQSMPKQFESRAVSNTQEFAQSLQSSGEIMKDDVMVSFDVVALFPSVPVKEAINLLEVWLLSQRNEDSSWRLKVRMYLKLTRLCMEENYFSFRGHFYKQTKGAPMGNPLSPFLCELFMSKLESTLKDQGLLPNRWWRYVDDVFSVVKQDSLPQILEVLNSVHKDIRFTHEVEKDGKLAFLDLFVIRELSTPSAVEYEVYRKPTNTRRVIPYSSNHCYQHKMAAFHHMIHRMQTLPLKEAAKTKELEYILETARINGYKESTIRAIIRKKEYTMLRKSLTTLSLDTEPLKRVSIPFDNSISFKLRPELKKIGLDLVFTSRNNQLKTLLGSTKDPVKVLNKAGVYEIKCKHCDKVYIGQTKRTLETRFREHIMEVNKAKKQQEKGFPYGFKSKVAEHIFTNDHEMTTDDIRILRTISTPWKLDVAESLEINKKRTSSLLNRDQGNGYTWLFNLLPTSHRRRSNGTPASTID